MEDDKISMDNNVLVNLISTGDDHGLEKNVLELEITNTKISKKALKTANKQKINTISRSIKKKNHNDSDIKITNESPKDNQPNESSKYVVKSQDAKTLLARELDQYLAENTHLSCCLCSQSLTDFSNLKKHFREVHNCVGYIPCCNNRFIKRTAYVDHLKLHKDPDFFKCKKCNKQLASRHNYQNHMYTVHPDTESLLFPCKMCSRKFAKQYILDYHIKSRHTNTKNYICETCTKGFKTSQLLKQHEKAVHLNTYDSVCDICGKCFKTAQNLATHLESLHETHRPGVQCKICSKRLKNIRCLNKHMVSHRDQESGQEFNCPHCDRVKSTRHALASHISYHHSAKVFTCKMCGKDFKRARALREHESTHTGTYLYTCPFCPKTFRSHGNMHKHRASNHLKEWGQRRSQQALVTNSLQSDVLCSARELT
ncbi:zinc finger protein 501-like [Eurosta solidaginis]|uniref:zinc finger protein 501-like n=1 Tax=Eurosta solidaginis TaxID=178769 RepID=UPI00353106D2